LVQIPILSFKGLALLIFLVGMMFLVQKCTAEEIHNKATAARDATVTARNVHCTVGAMSKEGKIMLHCPARGEKVLVDQTFALSYALHPRPLVCTLYQGNDPDCKFLKR